MSDFFDDGSFEEEEGGDDDETYTVDCGGNTDVVVMIGESCDWTCVGSLSEDGYEDICDEEDDFEIMIDGDYDGVTLYIGYLDEDFDESDLDCD